MKKEFSGKLAGYSAMASVLMLASAKSDAQIIYTDPADITTVGAGSFAYLDLDNNGIVDIIFKIGDDYPEYFGGRIDVKVPKYNLSLAATDGYCYFTGGFYTFRPFALKAGAHIGAAKMKWIDPTTYQCDLVNFTSYDTCNWWPGKNNRFLAFRLEVNPNSSHHYYGWIRLSVSKDGLAMVIKDWAYNAVPDEKIIAGQTLKVSEDAAPLSNNGIEIYTYDRKVFINNKTDDLFMEISIFNAEGKIKKELKMSDRSLTIELKDLPSGMYVVKTQSKEGATTKKLILE